MDKIKYLKKELRTYTVKELKEVNVFIEMLLEDMKSSDTLPTEILLLKILNTVSKGVIIWPEVPWELSIKIKKSFSKFSANLEGFLDRCPDLSRVKRMSFMETVLALWFEEMREKASHLNIPLSIRFILLQEINWESLLDKHAPGCIQSGLIKSLYPRDANGQRRVVRKLREGRD